MVNQYKQVEYGRSDGTILSEEQFFAEHPEVTFAPGEKDRLKQNLEVQCILIWKSFGNQEIIHIHGFCNRFISKDPSTKELYLTPIGRNLRVYFRKISFYLLIYDMKVVT